MSGLATPGDHLLQPSFRLLVIFIKVIPRLALPKAVCCTDEQTGPPAFAIPLRTSESWRPSVAGSRACSCQINVRYRKLVPAHTRLSENWPTLKP
jgi:hypothetical protein